MPSVAMLFQAVPFNALHSQMLYDPNKDPLWGEIKVPPACACAAAAARMRRRTRRTWARHCVPTVIVVERVGAACPDSYPAAILSHACRPPFRALFSSP